MDGIIDVVNEFIEMTGMPDIVKIIMTVIITTLITYLSTYIRRKFAKKQIMEYIKEGEDNAYKQLAKQSSYQTFIEMGLFVFLMLADGFTILTGYFVCMVVLFIIAVIYLGVQNTKKMYALVKDFKWYRQLWYYFLVVVPIINIPVLVVAWYLIKIEGSKVAIPLLYLSIFLMFPLVLNGIDILIELSRKSIRHKLTKVTIKDEGVILEAEKIISIEEINKDGLLFISYSEGNNIKVIYMQKEKCLFEYKPA